MIAYMFATYGPFGFFANIALVVNVVLILSVMSAMQQALTLPGIAGIVLTMGMAVDANVLINERIREEIAAGRTVLSALEAGYKRAMTTIIDSNLTAFITGVILYVLGTGLVRGFAVTLCVGIITSMFTAVTFSRWLTSMWVMRVRPRTLTV
jgi:protein-export membrane protein SecD